MTRRRIRSRITESRDVNQRRYSDGSIPRSALQRWAVGRDELAPGIVGDTHLHPSTIERIRQEAAPVGAGEIATVVAEGFVVPPGGTLVHWQDLVGDRAGFEAATVPGTGITVSRSGYYRATVALRWNDWFGGAVWITVDGTPRFPPPGDPMWESPPEGYAHRFEGSGEVLIEHGQALGVRVDHADGTARTLGRITGQFSLVEGALVQTTLVREKVWNVRRQGDSGHNWSGHPAGWTNPDAWWVWKYALGNPQGPVANEAPGGTMNAAAIVVVPAATPVTIEATADDEFTLRLNGAQILASGTGVGPEWWKTRYTTSVTLPAGANRFDVTAVNHPLPPGGGPTSNPAGWLFSMRRSADNTVILRSHEGHWFLA